MSPPDDEPSLPPPPLPSNDKTPQSPVSTGESFFPLPVSASVLLKDDRRSAIDSITDFFSSDSLTYCVVAMFVEPLETNDGLIYIAYSLKNGSVRPGEWSKLGRFVATAVDGFTEKTVVKVPVGLVLSSFRTKKYRDVTRGWMANTKTRESFYNKMAVLGKKLVSGVTHKDARKDLVSPWAHPYFVKTLSLYIDRSLAVTIGGKAFSSGAEVAVNSHIVLREMLNYLTPDNMCSVWLGNFKKRLDEEGDMVLSERRATKNIASNHTIRRQSRRRRQKSMLSPTTAAVCRDRSPLSRVPVAQEEEEEEEAALRLRQIPSFIVNIAPGHETPELEAMFPKTFIYTKLLAPAVVNETK